MASTAASFVRRGLTPWGMHDSGHILAQMASHEARDDVRFHCWNQEAMSWRGNLTILVTRL